MSEKEKAVLESWLFFFLFRLLIPFYRRIENAKANQTSKFWIYYIWELPLGIMSMLLVNKSAIPMKLILQCDWMLQFTLFYISMLLDKLLVYLLILSKESCRCYIVFSPSHVKCSIFFFTYSNRRWTFLYTYVDICSNILLTIYYFIYRFTANGTVTKAEFLENLHRLQVAGIVAKGCSSQ